jgi:hypothetical protein
MTLSCEINIYDKGDTVTITGTFRQNGVLGDPAAVHAHYKDPSGNQEDLVYGVDAELTKSSTGIYTFDIALDEDGDWWYRMDDNDTNVGAEGRLNVRTSEFT